MGCHLFGRGTGGASDRGKGGRAVVCWCREPPPEAFLNRKSEEVEFRFVQGVYFNIATLWSKR